MDMNDNALSGEIPNEHCSLPKLEELHLNFNELVGSILVAIGNLTKLEKLILYDNQLSGVVLTTISNLKCNILFFLSLFANYRKIFNNILCA